MSAKNTSGNGVIKRKLREFHRRVIMQDPFNHRAMIAVMDFAGKLFPNASKNESAIRQRDRAAVQNGDLGAPVTHEPGLINGRLNRNKILVGAAFFRDGRPLCPGDVEMIGKAGFDFLLLCDGGETRDAALDECLKNGLAAISITDGIPVGPGIRDAVKNGSIDFSGYRKHPAQVGDMGWDEPNTADFPYIAEYVRAYREALPGQFLFNNLLPDGSMRSQLGAKSYAEYVDRWADTVDSDYICLDHYPFYCSSLFNRIGFRIALNTYDRVASACRRTGRDFWIYTQTQGRWFAHMYLLVTSEQIRWQVYTALCYGARSIIQVAYAPAWGNDAYAMTDKDGSLTEQYLYAKRINAEIQKLSPVLADYRSLGVLSADAEKENRYLSPAVKRQNKRSKERGFSGIAEVRRVSSGSTALTGYFQNDAGGKAILLVNCRDLFDASASQRITVELNGEYRVRVYQKGELVADDRRSVVDIRLGSCNGAFITLDEVK